MFSPGFHRRIPLHIPQSLPERWPQYLAFPDVIPTEEQLSRKDYMEEEYYNNRVRIGLNTKALVAATMHAFASETVPTITYVGGGGFNEVFSLDFPHGFRVAARIPRRGRRAADRIESTVAMMTLARNYAGIPVPEVYAWHPGRDNPVGAPYMLLEWVEGIEPWEQWYNLGKEDRAQLLDELAAYHAKFAKPLPFQGIGDLCFSNAPVGDVLSFNQASSYRLVPFSQVSACTTSRGLISQPHATSTSFRDLWLQQWQHQVESISETFGSDRSFIIHPSAHPSISESITLGQLLDISQAMLVLIKGCQLPTSLELYEPSMVTMDYAFRNIKMDPTTRKITSFLDWDDVYVMPFLLCSRYPEDICYLDGSGERWYKTGTFRFLPIDEDGELKEDLVTEEKFEDEQDSSEVVGYDGSSSSSQRTTSSDGSGSAEHQSQKSDSQDPEDDTEDYDRVRRIQDTRLRRQYEQLLVSHDARFGIDGFWESRQDPLKIQYLLLQGWTEWIKKEEWKLCAHPRHD